MRYTYLFLILCIYSCQTHEEIGLDLQPGADRNEINFTDTLSIETSTQLFDSIITQNPDILQCGTYDDPYFGKVKAKFYTQVLLSKNNLQFSNSPTVDSVLLSLEYLDYYGDTSRIQTVHIYLLQDTLLRSRNYYNMTPINTGDIIAKKSFKVTPTTKITSGTGFLPPQFVIPLNKDVFQQMIVNKSGDQMLRSNDDFVTYFKGICVENIGDGAVMSFKLRSTYTKITMYYHDTVEDSLKLDFYINESCVRLNRINSIRENTILSNLKNNKDELKESETQFKTFLQDGIYTRIKVFIPNLQKLNEYDGKKHNIVINKAELKFFVEENIGVKLPPPITLYIFPLDTTGKPGNVPIQREPAGINASRYPLTLFYDEKNKSYSAPISSYIQAILLSRKNNNGLLLVPSVSPSFDLPLIGQTVNRIVVYGGKYPDLTKKMKLSIHFTLVD